MRGALRLSAYLGERERAPHGLLADALAGALERAGVAAGVMLRGIEGFGGAHGVHTERLLTLSEDLPLILTAIDEAERIGALLEEIRALRWKGLVTLQRARYAEISDGANAPGEAGEVRISAFLERGARWGGAPAHTRALQALHEAGAWSGSALLGLDGMLDSRRRRARVLSRNAEVPVLLESIVPAEACPGALQALLPIAGDGRVLIAGAGGGELPAAAPGAAGARVRLSVHTGGREHVHGQPLHEVLVRGLRRAGAAGATSVRAQRGFYGSYEPHGERLVSLRREGPVVTEVIERGERVHKLLELVHELCAGRAGVMSEELLAWEPYEGHLSEQEI